MIDTIQGVTVTQRPDPDPAPVVRVRQDNRAAAAKGADAPRRAVRGQSAVGQIGDISGVVSAVNDLVHQVSATKITFPLDEATGQTVVRVLDKETGEIIRQLPPEELLILVAKMEQLSGLIFSQEA